MRRPATESQPAPTRASVSLVWPGLLLTLATLLAYQPAWNGKPIWDDDQHLTRPELRSVAGLVRIWVHPGATEQYYPLTFSAFWLQHRLWGDSTLGYHLVNILLHAFSALLFLRILQRLKVPGAYLAAGIFALHPVHAESVAWMTELKNTLSGVFCLGATLAYLRFDQSRRRGLYAGALGLFVLGLTAKTAIATLPAGLLVILWWKRGKLSWKSDVLPLAPFFVAGVAAGLITVGIERKLFGAEGREFNFSLIERCLIAGRSLWFHLGKLFWPVDLAFMYRRWEISQSVWWQYLYPGAALALLAACLALRRWNRGPLAGVLIFAGTLFPALGFFNAYSFRYSFVNDHHQYLASLGIIALFSAGVAGSVSRWRPYGRTGVIVVSVALWATLAGLTWRQSRMYLDKETLWRTTILRTPGCWMAHTCLGAVFCEQGRTSDAIGQFHETLRLKPDDAEAYYNLGVALLDRGQIDQATSQFQEAVRLKPDYAEAHNNLGTAFYQQGRTDEAIGQFQEALRLKPDWLAHNSLGAALSQQGRTSEAIGQLQEAIRLKPDYADAHYNFANALGKKGQIDEAISQYQEAIRLKPDFFPPHLALAQILPGLGRLKDAVFHMEEFLRTCPPANLETPNSPVRERALDALNNLARLLATHPKAEERDGARAVRFAERACELTQYKQTIMVGTLAAAYAEAGRFPEAVRTAERAVSLATQTGDQALLARNQQLLELFRAGRPYHEPAM